MDNDPKTAEQANQRDGYTVIGSEATDDQVQHEAGEKVLKAGDELAARPETDLGNALYDYERGACGIVDVFVCAFGDASTHGDRRPTVTDVIKLTALLAEKLSGLAALLPK